MKYETPELISFNAITAVQATNQKRTITLLPDAVTPFNEHNPGYADWE